MRNPMRVTLIVLLALTSHAVAAANIGFLTRGPVAYLSQAEFEMLNAAVDKALEDAEEGEAIEWSNPDSGHNGTVTLLDIHEDFDTVCRTLRVYTEAAGRRGGGDFRLCLADDDTWRFAPQRKAD